MAATATQPCLTCGTPSNLPGGYCENCKPAYGYGTPLWDETRRLRLAQAHGQCELRVDRLCTGVATTVHRLPFYGTEHDGNLNAYRAACAHCHGVVDGPRATRRATLGR